MQDVLMHLNLTFPPRFIPTYSSASHYPSSVHFTCNVQTFRHKEDIQKSKLKVPVCSNCIYSKQGFAADDIQVLFNFIYSVILIASVKPRNALVVPYVGYSDSKSGI